MTHPGTAAPGVAVTVGGVNLPTACNAHEYIAALALPEGATLLGASDLYLSDADSLSTSYSLNVARDVLVHGQACFAAGHCPGAGQGGDSGQPISRVRPVDLGQVLGSPFLVTLMPCPNADLTAQLVVAAAGALTSAHDAEQQRHGASVDERLHAAMSLGLTPQTRPGLWERVTRGHTASRFLALASQAPPELVVDAVAKVDAAARRIRWQVDLDLAGTTMGEGHPWWVTMAHYELVTTSENRRVMRDRLRLVTTVPLRAVFDSNRGLVLAWQVPASFVPALTVDQTALAVMPATDDPAVDELMLRAVVDSSLRTPADVTRLVTALQAAQA